jgi:phage terminase large subunit-like protein
MSQTRGWEIPKPWLRLTRRFAIDWTKLLSKSKQRAYLADLPEALRTAVCDSWFLRSRLEQRPPTDDAWRTWLLLGGRGSGKTRAGAEWLAAGAGKGLRFALVGPSLHDVREVMIEGPSGLKSIAPPDNHPRYEVSRRRLVWPSGGVAYAHSAEDPDSLRGPAFDGAWCDEFCAWPKADATLALLRMGLRRGSDPRLVVTTTPKPLPALRRLMAEPGVVTHRMTTADNAAHLSPAFLAHLNDLYGGTRLAAQELEGLVVDDDAAALWRAEDLARCRGARPPAFDRVVVAVDPPATDRGDACGIVAAGRLGRIAFVLGDWTLQRPAPAAWAARAAEMAALVGASAVVAEANQGGDMVRATLAAAECRVPIRLVRARVGKRARAEPVAALYDQGRVVHCGVFPALEEEMMGIGTAEHGKSPDRADALVWALTDLMLGEEGRAPRVRGI